MTQQPVIQPGRRWCGRNRLGWSRHRRLDSSEKFLDTNRQRDNAIETPCEEPIPAALPASEVHNVLLAPAYYHNGVPFTRRGLQTLFQSDCINRVASAAGT